MKLMKAKRSNLAWTVLGMACLSIGSCADAKLMQPVPRLDILQVLPASGILVVGGTASLGAQHIKGPDALNVTADAQWTSDDPSIVTVDYTADTGAVVTAVGPGTAHITATAGGQTGTAEFVVKSEVTAVQLDKGQIEIADGTSKKLGVTLLGADGKKQHFDTGTWGSSDPEVATVDSKGVVTGVSPGVANITVTRGGLSATESIHVRDWTLESVASAASGGTNVLPGGSASIRVTGTFSDDHTQDVTSLFTFSVEGVTAETTDPVLTVDSTGAVTGGEKPGTGTIDGTGKAGSIVEGKSFKLDFSVIDPSTLSALTLELPKTLSTEGELAPITVTGTYEGDVEIETEATLTATPDGIVYVDPANLTITALMPGTATVKAEVTLNADDEDEDNDTTIDTSEEVQVSDAAVSSIELALSSDTDKASIAVGGITQLTATGSFGSNDEDLSDAAVWTSDNEAVAVVSNVAGGKVTGLSAGTAKITASYKGKSATFDVTVTQ
jgi:uncharacterized protein YjdB